MSKVMSRSEYIRRTRKKTPVGLKLKRIGRIFRKDMEDNEEDKGKGKQAIRMIMNLFKKK